MKLQMTAVLNLQTALQSLQNRSLPIKTTYKLTKLSKAVAT